MKKSLLVLLMILAAASFAAAQIAAPTQDILGAHLNYGRGCAACHAPHSGAWGNGANQSHDNAAGQSILWGQDVGNLYGQTITTAGGRIEVLPTKAEFIADSRTQPDVNGLLTCLSCHDGNWAQGAMMKDAVYEALPPSYGTYNTIPTLLGNDGDGAGNYLANHPVGLNAVIGCGGQYNWDCTVAANGAILMTGTNSSKFVQNYGFFVSPGVYNGTTPTVQCTTCHNQHDMNTVAVPGSSGSLMAAGYYRTMFFVRGPYNPFDQNAGSNQTAQFCRECHGGEANESNGGGNIGTVF